MLLMMVATQVMTLVLAMIIITRLIENGERRTCSTLRALIEAYQETPPVNETGRNIERAYREQYALYKCTPLPTPINGK